MIRALGHLGLWAGLYVLAALVCFAQLSGLVGVATALPRWDAVLCCVLTSTAVYALDRVKVRRSWLDPADTSAQPQRYGFLHRIDRRARILAVIFLLAGAAIGLRLAWYIPILVAASALGAIAYAPRARGERPRLKDRLWIKNAYAAGGITLFVGIVSIAAAAGPGLSDLVSWIASHALLCSIAAAVVALRVFLDAALCDIDDEAADRAFRTDTFAVALGPERVWNWTGLGRFGIALALPLMNPLPLRARTSWCLAIILGMLALRWRRPPRIRDTIDARFLPESLLVAALMVAWQAWSPS